MTKKYKKQVLFIIDSLGCGGAEKSLLALLPHLCYDQIDVDLYVRHGGLGDIKLPDGVRTVDLSPSPFKTFLANAIFSLRRRVASSVRHPAELLWSCSRHFVPRVKSHYDVAIAYQQGYPTFLLSEKINATHKIAWVNVNLKAAGYSTRFCAARHSGIDSVVAVSRTIANMLANDNFAPAHKITTIYDIMDPARIMRLASEGNGPEPLPKDVIRLVTVGRLVSQKNHALAVRAAAELKRRGFDFVWHFVGDGPEKQNIAELTTELGVDDCIRFEGVQSNPYPFFAAADIYVQPSSFEGYGLTLAEARVLGRPVVATCFEMVYEHIKDGINGFIADMTPESLADKIEIIAQNESVRHQMAANAMAEPVHTAVSESTKVNSLILQR